MGGREGREARRGDGISRRKVSQATAEQRGEDGRTERSEMGDWPMKREAPLTVSCLGLVLVRFLSIRRAEKSRRSVGSGGESAAERE